MQENDKKLDINELKDKAKARTQEIGAKLASKENKEKLNSLFYHFLKGVSCVLSLICKGLDKILSLINKKINDLDTLKKSNTQGETE